MILARISLGKGTKKEKEGKKVCIQTAELNRRVQVTATRSWGPTLTEQVRTEVDYQVAAPTEARTPTLHRATIAHQRVRMEGWRQRRLS